jgi:arginyl-tRNA synthetase
MKKLGAPYAEGLHHLSYGMVDLPSGKMKSREGIVVDADDLIAEVIEEARNETMEKGDISSFSKEEQEDILQKIGLAALKFFIIKVNPQKRMIFDPKESVELQGQTGPYIQYSYVRTKGVWQLGQKENVDLENSIKYLSLEAQEKDLILQIHEYPELIQQAADTFDPSLIANYCYKLSKSYHKFYHDLKIVGVEPETEAFRLKLSKSVGDVLKSAMELLGIEMPERM